MKAESYKCTAGHLTDSYSKDFCFAFALAVLATSLHSWALVAEFSMTADFTTLTSPTILYFYLLIELGLLVNLLGMWLRTPSGLRVSILAISIVGAGYAFWYAYSRQVLGSLLSEPFYQAHPEAVPSHPFGLLGATWLNLTVFLMSGALFFWGVRVYRKQATPNRSARAPY
jgi:hypothetical protein